MSYHTFRFFPFWDCLSIRFGNCAVTTLQTRDSYARRDVDADFNSALRIDDQSHPYTSGAGIKPTGLQHGLSLSPMIGKRFRVRNPSIPS